MSGNSSLKKAKNTKSVRRPVSRRIPKSKQLAILQGDPWLQPYAEAIEGRHNDAILREKQLLGTELKSLSDFANAHRYFGLHRLPDGSWVFREYAPNADSIYLIGDFTGWERRPEFALRRLPNGTWEGIFPSDAILPGQLYKMLVQWRGGEGERLPAYATRVVQDTSTAIFSAQVPYEEPYRWTHTEFAPDTHPLLIYECHIGMAQNIEGVGTYDEFRINVLPRIAADGYNAIQIMAIQEHPYYGSFGYHVSNFFAPSSRFGTPNELRRLIDEAHGLGIAVIMDIVHSHAVKNENEGPACIDGSRDLYFHSDASRRMHPAWDSLCFDYGKTEVLHFLLSNCKYWMEEFHFDGFRFDGVTSMLYYNHGLGQAFGGYGDYYDGGQDVDAITYLTLANKLIHSLNHRAITIAEEMSGMPGLATPIADGGIGFDYRMAMGIPDYWIKTIKERKDEDWHPTSIFWELTNRRSDEKTISYVESHDQALVGDKTVFFRLVDDHIYWHMMRDDDDYAVNRGIALHKMIRLVTLATINGGYLNFMGNEFGHPEWIDFPREGNGWSYKYARRQWDLVDNPDLKYQYLGAFDNAMIDVVSRVYNFQALPIRKLWEKDDDQILAFMRGDLVFVFNFNPVKSFTGYGILVPPGRYDIVMSSDDTEFGGFGNVEHSVPHLTITDELYRPAGIEWLKLYIPARTAIVLRRKR